MKKVAIILIFHICIPFPGGSIVLPRYCRNRVYKNKNQILFATQAPPLIIKQNPPILHIKNRRIVLLYPFRLFAIFLPYPFRLLAIFLSSLPHKASCYIYFFLSLYTSGGKSFYKELLTGDEDDEDR